MDVWLDGKGHFHQSLSVSYYFSVRKLRTTPKDFAILVGERNTYIRLLFDFESFSKSPKAAVLPRDEDSLYVHTRMGVKG